MSIVKLNNRAVKDATAVGSITGLGNLVFISRSTASSSASVSITSGIDSTYKEYIFVFNNLHPASNSNLQFQTSTNGGSGYGVTATTIFFYASHQENDGEAIVSYKTNRDNAQTTDFIYLTGDNMEASGTDASVSGYLHLFEPSSSVFVKHYIARMSTIEHRDRMLDVFTAGYFNTTSAIDALIFRMSSGNIDSGTIDMYGVL